MRWLFLAVALAAATVTCGSDVVLEQTTTSAASSTAASTASVGGQGGEPAATGGGGAAECEGAIIAVDRSPMVFEHACTGSNPETSCPLGFYQVGGPPNSQSLVIEGCYGPNRELHMFRLEVPVDSQEPATWSNAELVVDIYWTDPRNTFVTLTNVGEVGGYIEGTFETVLYQIDQDMPATGSFRVKRVADVVLP